MTDRFEHVTTAMDTVITVQVVNPPPDVERRVQDALLWFDRVESTCSRFDVTSELVQLSHQIGTPVAVSPLLFHLLELAVAVSERSRGAFSPLLGATLEARGFDRHWRTGRPVALAPLGAAAQTRGASATIWLDANSSSVTLSAPCLLDLGAIAKGFAVDLVVQALDDLSHVAVDAGGDGYYRGRNVAQHPWRVGIRAPEPERTHPPRLAATIDVENAAVCTSGDYLRRGTSGATHLINPRDGSEGAEVRSVSVCAANAALADALATAAFVLGPASAHAMLADEDASAFFQMADGSHCITGDGRYRTAWQVFPMDSPAPTPRLAW